MQVKCKICKEEMEGGVLKRGATSLFNVHYFKIEPYCIKHLMKEFSDAFFKFKHKMVIFPPIVKEPGPGGYEYRFSTFSSDERSHVTGAIGKQGKLITGKCTKCNSDAQVAIFDEQCILEEGGGPNLNIYSAIPEILCKECSFELLKPQLQAFALEYDAVFLPYAGDGGFHIKVI